MAFQKSVTLASGVSGDYHRINSLRWDHVSKELQVALALYVDAAAAAAGAAPLVPEYARFRLYLDRFDYYVSRDVVASAALGDVDFIEIIYTAIKEVCENCETTGVTDPKEHLISDGGHDFFHDATDV